MMIDRLDSIGEIMELYAELKIVGDGYGGGFSCGMSMTESDTSAGMKKTGETCDGNRKETVYEDHRKLRVRVMEDRDEYADRIHTEFENNSDSDVTLEMISSFALKGVRADKFHRLQSFWSAEGKLKTETIEDLHLEMSWNGCARRIEKFGNTGSMPVRKYFPFLVLEDSERKEFTGILIGLASSWQIEISCRGSQEFDVMGGIADREFGHWMKKISPGEKFVTPDIILAHGDSFEEVCDRLVKTQHPDISPEDNDMGIMFNEYCTSWGNPDLDSIKRLSDKLEGLGVKYLIIDSGWSGLPQDWAQSVGNWEVNKDRFPNGLKEAAGYIRSKGMIPGLWFEPEVAGPHSKYFSDSDMVLKKDGYPLTVSGRRFLDMENPAVIEHLSEDVIGTLKNAGFGYLKIDYNDTIGIGCDGPESLGEELRKKVLCTQEFIKKIKEDIPGIVIENCSSGGHRLVYSMMELVSQASFSDAHETKAIPVIAANMHRVIHPSQSQIWAVLRKCDDPDRLHYSLAATFLGRMCLSGDIYDLSEEQLDIVREGISFYRKAADIIKYGKTVKIESSVTNYNDPKGQQLVIREYEGRKLIICHRFKDSNPMDPALLRSGKVSSEFGRAGKDFSAYACILDPA